MYPAITVSIVSMLRYRQPKNWGSIHKGKSFFLQVTQTGPSLYPAPYSKVTLDCYSYGKAAGAWSYPPTLPPESTSRISGTIHPFPHTPSQRANWYNIFKHTYAFLSLTNMIFLGKTEGMLNWATINMYVKFYTAGNHMVQKNRWDSSFQIFPNLKMG